ncbi:MAG: amidohydrolase family protein [Myxococcales bacterium]|nr:amidohydrolase family protein [Myxococcales bacterium]
MQRPGTTGARPAGIARAATPGVLTLSLLCAAVIAGSRTAGAVDAIACDTGLPASTMGLFDGHNHLRNIADAAAGEVKLDELAAAGVALGMIALATPDATANEAVRDMQSASAYPVFAFARAPTVVVDGEKTFPSTADDVVAAQLGDGATGVGEMTLRHSGPPILAANIAADETTAMAIYALAGTHGVPVSIHFETRDKSAPEVDIASRIEELRAALSANSDTRFLWAHLGDTEATTVRALIEEFDNLYADLSTRNPYYIRGWPVALQSLSTESEGTFTLKTEWRDLFEDHPQRFLFGLDIASDDRVDQLDDVVSYYRGVLGELSQATAEKIACKNARALLAPPSLPAPSGPWLIALALLLLVAGVVGVKRLYEVTPGQ